MSAPLKVGFVGLSASGWASASLGPALTDPSLRDKYTLTAIATTSEASSKASSEKWSQEIGQPIKPYSSVGDMLDGSGDDLDLVVVSVGAAYHKQVALPVIRAKKNIFIEWPAGSCGKETVEIAEEAKKYGVRTFIGLQTRQSPVMNKAKQLIESGKIGKVLSTNFIALLPREARVWTPETVESNMRYLNKSFGVTPMSILGGHALAGFTNVLGQFSSVSATGVTHFPVTTIFDPATGKPTGKTYEPDVGPDHITVTGTMSSGALATLTWRFGVPTTPGRLKLLWEIDGDEGSIRMESDEFMGGLLNNSEPAKLSLNGEEVEVRERDVTGPQGMLKRNFEEYIKGEGVGTYATIDDAVKLRQLLDAIDESLATGSRVKL